MYTRLYVCISIAVSVHKYLYIIYILARLPGFARDSIVTKLVIFTLAGLNYVTPFHIF